MTRGLYPIDWWLGRISGLGEGGGALVPGPPKSTIWSRRGDLNPRPTTYEAVALPLSYVGATSDSTGQGFTSRIGRWPIR